MSASPAGRFWEDALDSARPQSSKIIKAGHIGEKPVAWERIACVGMDIPPHQRPLGHLARTLFMQNLKEGFDDEDQTASNHPIRAVIVGADQCAALGHKVRAPAPVLTLCRELVASGYDPDRPLHVYRDKVLALRVRSIGEAARLRVATHGVGFEPAQECTAASPMRFPVRAARLASGSTFIGSSRPKKGCPGLAPHPAGDSNVPKG